MVSVGDEGFHPGVGGTPSSFPYTVADGVDHARLTAIPSVDFGTYHLYPQAWGQSPAQDWGTGWINDHNTVGTTLNKPEILEEFGTTDQSTRDATYTAWTNAVRTGGGDGWNFWLLTGIQDDGQLYPDFDGFRVVTPSATATLLTGAAQQIGGGGGGDTTPPSQPGTPAVSGVTATGATLSWIASTDNVGVAGYTVFREQGATDPVLAQPTTNSVTLTGLTPATQYQVYVRARDAAGNLSNASALATFTTAAQPGGGCRIGYTPSNWGGTNGFTAMVTITNTGANPINGWTLGFAFTAGQRLTDSWSATWAQAPGSPNVTATNLSWNATIVPNASVGIGFNGSHTGSNPAPAVFTLNGTACATS